jgi:signal transduction histidine kinase
MRHSVICESTKQAGQSLALSPAGATHDSRSFKVSGTPFPIECADSTVAGLAHDARNLLSAVHLFCELLAVPGVLAPSFRHYAQDLRCIGITGGRLQERLIAALAAAPTGGVADSPAHPPTETPSSSHSVTPVIGPIALPMASRPKIVRHAFPGIRDIAAELDQMRELLAALAGPEVRFEIESAPCSGELAINSEDLLRILFNLIANSVEAMHSHAQSSSAGLVRSAGFIRVTVQRGGATSFLPYHDIGHAETVLLCVRDNGPGITAEHLPHIFSPGYSTRESVIGNDNCKSALPASFENLQTGRGLGLSNVRQIVEAAGGAVRAVCSPGLGTRFDIELPVIGSGASGPDLAERDRNETQPAATSIERKARMRSVP